MSQKETLNNVLFFSFLFIFITINIGIFFNYAVSLFENIFLFFLVFAGIIYGFISKNSVKSFLIGFLLWPVFLFFSFVRDLSAFEFMELLLSYLPVSIIIFVISLLWGLPGFFTAKIFSEDGKRGLHLILTALTTLIIFVMLIFIFLD